MQISATHFLGLARAKKSSWILSLVKLGFADVGGDVPIVARTPTKGTRSLETKDYAVSECRNFVPKQAFTRYFH